MVTVWDVLSFLYLDLYISMFPVGDDPGDLSLGPWDGSPVAAPPPNKLSASYLYTLIRTDKGFHINLLAAVIAVLVGFQALLGSRRRRSGNKFFVIPLSVAYSASFPLFVYTIGLVQSVEAPNRLDSQLLWAVGLLLLLGSVNGMSALSRSDVEQRKGMQTQHIIKTVVVLWLLVTRCDVSEHRWILLLYFLLCWVYSILRVAQRMAALRKASSAHGLVRSSKVVADYMEGIYTSSAGVIHDPRDMAQCKYLVLGEEEDSSPPSGPPYLTKVGGRGKVVVTFDMIWICKDKLLSPALKDTCLSFALFKLLKRRFCGQLRIAERGDQKALDFVLADDERAFRLVELELSFLYDLFYTKYPALYPGDRPAVLGVVRFVVLLGLFKVLLIDFTINTILFYDDAPENTFIFFNNVLVVVMILAVDILQGVATGYSNWAIVHFVCDYLRDRDDDDKGWWKTAKRWWKRGLGIRRALMKRVAARRARKSAHWWDNKLGQYSLLKSYDYRPRKTNALSLLSLRLMEKAGEGRHGDSAVPLTAQVKTAVLSSLRANNGLPAVGRSVNKPGDGDLHWACNLPTHTHTVLVWHIATTMCDVRDPIQLTGKPEQQEYLESDEYRCRAIATALSGYCAYLLASVPDLLPDDGCYARQILDAVVQEARTHLMDEMASDRRQAAKALDAVVDEARKHIVGTTKREMSRRCEKMVQLRGADASILSLGAKLGRQLRCVEKPRRSDLLLFLAPSDKPAAHADRLAAGGEFITHLWALLTHAGIVDRSDVKSAPEV